jgi:hypothetical protein
VAGKGHHSGRAPGVVCRPSTHLVRDQARVIRMRSRGDASEHVRVPALLWDDVRDLFDTTHRGVLPDVSVAATTVQDWQEVVDLVRSRGLRYEYSEDGRRTRLPTRIGRVFDRQGAVGTLLRVWPAPGMVANFYFWRPEEIEFDVDLEQLQGQKRLDLLCAFLRLIGRKLSRPVIMTEEGSHREPLIGYDPGTDRVVRWAPTLRESG